MEYFDQFVEFISGQSPLLIYTTLFLGAFFENLIPPIPGDSIIVFGAYLSGRGVLGKTEAFIWMWIGSYTGCLLLYAIGYTKGREFFISRSPRIFSPERFAQAERWFDRYGGKLIVFNRFLPGVRCVIGISAGLSRVKPWRMGLYVALGTLLWNGILVYTGILVGSNWKLILQILKTYNHIMMGLFLLAGLALAFIWLRRRKKRAPTGNDRSDPRLDDRKVG